uniref:(California timema) hypothetical protein n=1 Tax=Timema californicum TaxID=61474 RepID=A0A7R9JA10_TIMCA|nr:unnamed protein product [Timema californicum]
MSSATALVSDADSKDTREGEDVTLECRFAPQLSSQNNTYFWGRTRSSTFENVAIQQAPLDPNYRVDFRPEQGRYDLVISNTSFDRDNGQFECQVRAAGSGRNLHSQAYNLTVLTVPGPPRITPGPSPSATEGKVLELSCSSRGGSPEPLVRWYKEGSNYPLEANIASRNSVTTAVLSLTPSRTDDGVVYRCVVR